MKQRRRKTRVLALAVPLVDQPLLVFQGKHYFLRNFGADSLGVWMPKMQVVSFQNYEAILQYKGRAHPVKIQCVHQSNKYYGFKVVEQPKELEESLTLLLVSGAEAESLSVENIQILKGSSFLDPRLYILGAAQVELTIGYNSNSLMIDFLQVCFSGRWIYREREQLPRTGFLKPDFKRSGGVLLKESDLLHVDIKKDKTSLKEAAIFLAALPLPLPGHLLLQFLDAGDTVSLSKELFSQVKSAA